MDSSNILILSLTDRLCEPIVIVKSPEDGLYVAALIL